MEKIEEVNENKGGFQGWIIWFLAALFYLYEYLIRVTPSVMDAELRMAFGVNNAQLADATTAYYYIYGPMQLIVGMLFDRFGGKRLLVPATLIVAAGCYVSTLSTQSLMVITIGRSLQGFGSAFGFVGAIYLATVWFPAHRIAFFAGLTTALGMLGAIMGETFFAKIVDLYGWQSSLVYSAHIGVVLAVLIALTIPSVPKWELKRRQKLKESSNFLTGLFTVVKNPQTWIIGTVGGCLFLPLSLFAERWALPYIMEASGVSKTTAGSAVSSLLLGWLIGSPLAGWLSDTLKIRKKPMLWGLLSATALFFCLFTLKAIPFPVLCAILFLSGLLCSVEVISFVAGEESNPAHLKGTSIAVINMIITLLGGLGQHIVGYLLVYFSKSNATFETTGSENLVYNTLNDYRMALLILPISILLGFILCFFMKETYNKKKKLN